MRYTREKSRKEVAVMEKETIIAQEREKEIARLKR